MLQTINQEIGSRLRHARKHYGYRSARSFAQKHNIPESTYSQHETGARALSPKLMVHYCRIFNIDPAWLIMGRAGEETVYAASYDEGKIVPRVLYNTTALGGDSQ